MNFLSVELLEKLKSYYPDIDKNNTEEVENALLCVISGFKKDFSNNMKRIRTSLQMTQASAAELFDVAYPSFAAWEKGKSVPRLSKLKEICEGYKIDPAELIEFNPVSKTDFNTPVLDLDFFKAKSFENAFRDFHQTDKNKFKTVSAGADTFDFAVQNDCQCIFREKIIERKSTVFCSWKELAGLDQHSQMKAADGKIALVSIIFENICFREIHFDSKFLHLFINNEEKVLPVALKDADSLEDKEQAKLYGHITPASMIQIFAIAKRTVVDLD